MRPVELGEGVPLGVLAVELATQVIVIVMRTILIEVLHYHRTL